MSPKNNLNKYMDCSKKKKKRKKRRRRRRRYMALVNNQTIPKCNKKQ